MTGKRKSGRSGCLGIIGLGALILVIVAIAQGNNSPGSSTSSPTAPPAISTPTAQPPTAAPTAAPKPTAKPAPPPVTSGTNKTAAKAAGATAICRDGTWSYSAHRSGTCSDHRGVYWWTGNLGPPGP